MQTRPSYEQLRKPSSMYRHATHYSSRIANLQRRKVCEKRPTRGDLGHLGSIKHGMMLWCAMWSCQSSQIKNTVFRRAEHAGW
jgi:hypothetical protein